MDVFIVPVLDDNYSYVVVDKTTKKAVCIDPVDPAKVLECVNKANAHPVVTICTHKHWDHSDGNKKIKDMVPGMIILTTPYEPIPGADQFLKDKETTEIGDMKIQAFHTPCHTKGHECFYFTSKSDPDQVPIVFTADTLFVGGCGRFFEGTGADMNYALNTVLSSLPQNTLVYCGHEYTKKNLQFAMAVEPNNEALKAKYDWVVQQLSQGGYSVPTTIGDEKKYNPFMRVGEASVKMAVTGGTTASDDECMTQLRAWKDKS